MSEPRIVPRLLLRYALVDDYLERRPPYRAEHLALYRETVAAGDLILGGALDDPTDEALLIFNTANRGVVESFAQRDPYVIHGLVISYEIRVWNAVELTSTLQ